MIIDGEVGTKTLEEYRLASQLFHNHRLPVYISIFFKSTPTRSANQNGYISFDDFRTRYLCSARYGNDGSITVDDRIYGYPFETADDIKRKVKSEIRKWIQSPSRPLLNSKLGRDFSSDDFYTDPLRKVNCIQGMYFRRKFDKELQTELEGSKNVVYLYGDSLSGKTRAVFYAISKIHNGWFYKMKEPEYGRNAVEEEINDVATYLETACPDLKQYLVFDDFDKYKFNDEQLVNALESLFFQIRGKNCAVVITASIPLDDLPVANLFANLFANLSVARIEIPPMSSAEHVEAIHFFKKNGVISIPEQNSRYHTTGALLIDLQKIKSDYTRRLKPNNLDSWQDAQLSRMVLRTIKAFSIWHNSNMGDLDGMHDFCTYLMRKSNASGQLLSREAFDRVIHILSECPGIRYNEHSTPEGRPVKSIEVQEYVYRYFINYKGEIMLDDEVCSADDELDLIYLIFSYVYEKRTPLIIDFGKIISRCEHRLEVSKKLFDLFRGVEAPLEGCNGWIDRLLEEKRLLEAGRAEDVMAVEEASQYYSKIFKQQIYGAKDFTEALQYYKDGPRKPARHLLVWGAPWQGGDSR